MQSGMLIGVDHGRSAQQPPRAFPAAIAFGLMTPRREGHAIDAMYSTLGECARNLIIG
mgnify:CR=1 FL=1